MDPRAGFGGIVISAPGSSGPLASLSAHWESRCQKTRTDLGIGFLSVVRFRQTYTMNGTFQDSVCIWFECIEPSAVRVCIATYVYMLKVTGVPWNILASSGSSFRVSTQCAEGLRILSGVDSLN